MIPSMAGVLADAEVMLTHGKPAPGILEYAADRTA